MSEVCRDSLSPGEKVILAEMRRIAEGQQRAELVKHEDNKKRIERLTEMQIKMEAEIAAVARGFPKGDPDAHRRYHETVIEWRELRNKIVREALINAAKVGGLGAIGWLCYAAWIAFKMEITR